METTKATASSRRQAHIGQPTYMGHKARFTKRLPPHAKDIMR